MSKRIIGYDVARAAAILGMMFINFWLIILAHEYRGQGVIAKLVGLVNGRAAATFVVLAGVGISLLTREARQSPEKIRQNRILLLKRGAFLLMVGLLFHFVWPNDILHFYGVYLVLAAGLIVVPDRWLLVAAAGAAAGFVLLLFLIDYKTGWDAYIADYVNFWTVKGFLLSVFYNGDHPVLPWMTFLCIGMWLGRQDTTPAAFRQRMFMIGFVCWIGAEMMSRGLARVLDVDVSDMVNLDIQTALLSRQPIPPAPLYVLAGIGAALMVISACLTIGQRFGQAGWLQPFVYTGQLALTIYIGHVLFGMGILLVLGNLRNHSPVFTVVYTVFIFGICVVFSTLWRQRYQRGPLEWVMRRFSQETWATPVQRYLWSRKHP